MEVFKTIPATPLLEFHFPSSDNKKKKKKVKSEHENMRINMFGSRFTFLLLKITLDNFFF